MNKYIMSISVIACIVFLSSLAVAQVASGPIIKADVLKYDPAPAEPGNFLDLWLSIDNTGSDTANDYIVELIPAYPFYLDSNENAIRNYSSIDSIGVIAEYKLRIAEDAPNGEAILKVKHYKRGSSIAVIDELKVSIIGKVDVDILSIEPNTLIPGNPTKVVFSVNNSGRAPVRDMIITWNDPNNKILPLAGENRYRIQNLDIGNSTEVVFSMIADPSATQGVHMINVNMSFQRFGISDSRTSQIAFIVGGLTDFDVAQQDIRDNTISISVANIGVNTATGVLLTVPEQQDWRIIGGSNVFLGNLNSGDFTVASLQLQSLVQDSIRNLTVHLQYTDTTGIRQKTEKTMNINFAKATEKKESPNFMLYAVIAIIIIAVIWYMFRKSSKKR